MSTNSTETELKQDDNSKNTSLSKKRDASWPSVLFYIHLNILGFYGVLVLLNYTSFLTFIFTILLSLFGILGATAGAHRLWAHQTYTANTTLKIFLMVCQTLAGHGSIYDWVRSHRLHHKTFKTDMDPFYSNKDFLSGQVYAQIRSYSPEQEKMLEEIDMKDLEEDKVVMFQKRFYWILYLVICVLLPINAPLEYWNDTVSAAIFVTFSLRYLIVFNMCALINSAHFVWSLDKDHKPSDSNMIFFITKTYWPQYHYLLPQDYQSDEYGGYGDGCTTTWIRVFAALGIATNLITITPDAVKRGLTNGLDSSKSLSECIMEEALKDIERLPYDYYLQKKNKGL